MSGERTYIIGYMKYENDIEKHSYVQARYAVEAYDKFMKNDGWRNYASWVVAYINREGRRHYFNNHIGKPY